MSEQDLLNAPRTLNLLKALEAYRVDVRPGSGLYAALMEFAHVEATKTAELVEEFWRTNPIRLELKTSDEAQRVLEQVRSEEKETIKALADALDAVHNWDQQTREHPEKPWPSPMPVVKAALRLAGRLP